MTVLTFNTLPLGYRFRPTDEELVDYYLRNKINGNDNDVKVIREIDVCKWEPWDLPGLSVVQSNDLEWYFFCPRDQKYPNGPRLNRATEAGYWKATGKDRKIKNRVSEIGTKKTLVFYRGRAPKGKRSNWVMHEYRPTLPELDGTHPGQNAFVLCRLFKKLDESVESPHSDEVEPTLSSPTATNSSPGYIQSELALEQEKQALVLQNEKQPTISESCQGKDLEKISGSILTPLECHNHNDNAYDADDHAAAVAATEVDPPQVEYSDWLSDLIVDPEDCIPFSPLSTQMRAELGSSDMRYPVPNEFSNDRSGLQFQCDTNEQDAHISELLNSILIESKDDYYFRDPGTQKTLTAENKTPKYISTISHYKDSVKDGRSCSELDPESAQAQLDTGIRIRNRQPEDYSSSTYFVSLQGSTHRRVRMQTKLEIGTLNSRETDLGFGAEGTKENSTVTEVEKPAESHAADAASATTVDELQMVTLSTGRAQWSKGMSRGIGPQYRDGNDASMFAKTGGVHRRSFWSPMSMLRRVGVVMVFCAVLVGLRRCIEY